MCVSVFQKYKSYSPYDMQESIRKEVKGDLEKSFLTLGMPTSPTTPAKTRSEISKWIIIGLFAGSFVFVFNVEPQRRLCVTVSVVVDCLENKQLYFASRLHDAMKVDTLLPLLL